MRNLTRTTLVVLAILVMASGRGFGEIYFNDGGTHNIDYVVTETILVNYPYDEQNPLPLNTYTKVYVEEGGNLYNGIESYKNSSVIINGGQSYHAYAIDGQVTVNGGYINGAVIAGAYFADWTRIGGQVVMNGGNAEGLQASAIGECILTGGSVNAMSISDMANSSMTGGSTATLRMYDDARLDWSGGIVRAEIFTMGQSEIVIHGSNFTYDGIPIGFGEITFALSGYAGKQLSGILANGDRINCLAEVYDDSKIILIPEPATLLLLGLGGLMSCRCLSCRGR